MVKKNIMLKILLSFTLGILLMIGVGYFYNGGKLTFKSNITPIDKINTDKKVVAIACNVYEGEDVLPSMLETLKKHNVKASFFIGGVWGKNNIDMIEKMHLEGHDIQNHGYYHKKPTQLSESDNIKEIMLTHELLKTNLNIETTIFEPPYGDFNEYTQKIVNKSNHTLVTFNIDTIDWRKDASPEILLQRVQKKLNPGGIVLTHPKEVTDKSLDSIITYIKSQGYEIITVNELLKLN